MRRSCDSSMYWCSSSASALADAVIVPERLLDDDPRICRHARFRQAADDRSEERRRNLEVEDWGLHALDRLRDLGVGCVVREISMVVREPLREPSEHLLVELLSRADDRVARTLNELLQRPVVECDADDRTVEEPALLESVERVEGHHLREVARDSEDHEDVGRLRIGVRLRPDRLWSLVLRSCPHPSSLRVVETAQARSTWSVGSFGAFRRHVVLAQASWISSSDFPFVSSTLSMIHTNAITHIAANRRNVADFAGRPTRRT